MRMCFVWGLGINFFWSFLCFLLSVSYYGGFSKSMEQFFPIRKGNGWFYPLQGTMIWGISLSCKILNSSFPELGGYGSNFQTAMAINKWVQDPKSK